MIYLENFIRQIPYMDNPFMLKVIKSIILIFLIWLIKLLFSKILLKRIKDIKLHYRWRKVLNTVYFIIVAIVVGRLWFEGVQSIVTFLGLLSAGVAIALKDPISNLAGWIFIISRKPFEVGDRIQLGNNAGDVIDLSAFEFSILEIGNWVEADQSTGRIIHVPNGKIFTEELANYDKGFKYIWNEIRIVITFESNWQKAKKILTDIANKQGGNITASMERQIKQAAQKFMIYYHNLTPIVYTDVKENGVQLTIRHLTEIRKRRKMTELIWEDVLAEFALHDDIELAYPTTRFYKLGE